MCTSNGASPDSLRPWYDQRASPVDTLPSASRNPCALACPCARSVGQRPSSRVLASRAPAGAAHRAGTAPSANSGPSRPSCGAFTSRFHSSARPPRVHWPCTFALLPAASMRAVKRAGVAGWLCNDASPCSATPASTLLRSATRAWPFRPASVSSHWSRSFGRSSSRGTSSAKSASPLKRCGPRRHADCDSPGNQGSGSKSFKRALPTTCQGADVAARCALPASVNSAGPALACSSRTSMRSAVPLAATRTCTARAVSVLRWPSSSA